MHEKVTITGAGYAHVEEMHGGLKTIGTGLAICPVVHLAALQEIQPVLTTYDNTGEYHLINY